MCQATAKRIQYGNDSSAYLFNIFNKIIIAYCYNIWVIWVILMERKEQQPALSVDELINNLKDKNLIIEDEEYAKSLLTDISYFNVNWITQNLR